jgi:hypothetical protein
MQQISINPTPFWYTGPIVPITLLKTSTSNCLPSLLIPAMPKVVVITIMVVSLKVVSSTPIVMLICITHASSATRFSLGKVSTSTKTRT